MEWAIRGYAESILEIRGEGADTLAVLPRVPGVRHFALVCNNRRVELGYQGNVDWQDMSDYLVHFVGGREATPDRRFDVLRNVLQDRELKPGIGGFGFAKGWASPQHTQRSVCMSEVPLTYLARLVSRHGSFGVGLAKTDVRAAGGQRVWYVDDSTEPMNVLDDLLAEVTDARRWADPLWKLTRFIDRVTPDGDGRARYEFEWEREWRVPGGMHLSEVKFLFVPSIWHELARTSLGAHRLIDPMWGSAQIATALAS